MYDVSPGTDERRWPLDLLRRKAHKEGPPFRREAHDDVAATHTTSRRYAQCCRDSLTHNTMCSFTVSQEISGRTLKQCRCCRYHTGLRSKAGTGGCFAPDSGPSYRSSKLEHAATFANSHTRALGTTLSSIHDRRNAILSMPEAMSRTGWASERKRPKSWEDLQANTAPRGTPLLRRWRLIQRSHASNTYPAPRPYERLRCASVGRT